LTFVSGASRLVTVLAASSLATRAREGRCWRKWSWRPPARWRRSGGLDWRQPRGVGVEGVEVAALGYRGAIEGLPERAERGADRRFVHVVGRAEDPDARAVVRPDLPAQHLRPGVTAPLLGHHVVVTATRRQVRGVEADDEIG